MLIQARFQALPNSNVARLLILSRYANILVLNNYENNRFLKKWMIIKT